MDDSLDGTTLGLAYGHVRLVESDPGWPHAFQRKAAELKVTLGRLVVAVEHVGSTAVPGLAAKPILDIAIRLAPVAALDRVVTALQALGYQFRGDKGNYGGLLLVLENRSAYRIAHLHLIRHDDRQWDQYLALRGRLRTDPSARAAYAQLRTILAIRFPTDRRAYTAAKAELISKLLSMEGHEPSDDMYINF